MNREIIAALEEHEKEDKHMETLPWRDALCGEFANSEEIISIVDALLKEHHLELSNLQLVYQVMRRRKTVGDVGVPMRTAAGFSLRKHTSSFFAYYHSHDYYEMLYVYRGYLVQYLEKSPLPSVLPAGTMCLLAPGMIHALEPVKENDVVFKIAIPCGMLEEVGKICPGTIQEMEEMLISGPVQIQTENGHFTELMQLLAQEYLCESTPQDSAAVACLALIFIRITRIYKGSARHCEMMVQVVSYLKGHLTNASLQELAAQMGYSPDHLGRCIRRDSGESFTRLRQRLRMEKAAQFLTDTDQSVEMIAENCGYKSFSGFYKLFVKEYGLTPSMYRKIMK